MQQYMGFYLIYTPASIIISIAPGSLESRNYSELLCLQKEFRDFPSITSETDFPLPTIKSI